MNIIRINNIEHLNLNEPKLAILCADGNFVLANDWEIMYHDSKESLIYSYGTRPKPRKSFTDLIYTVGKSVISRRFW